MWIVDSAEVVIVAAAWRAESSILNRYHFITNNLQNCVFPALRRPRNHHIIQMYSYDLSYSVATSIHHEEENVLQILFFGTANLGDLSGRTIVSGHSKPHLKSPILVNLDITIHNSSSLSKYSFAFVSLYQECLLSAKTRTRLDL